MYRSRRPDRSNRRFDRFGITPPAGSASDLAAEVIRKAQTEPADAVLRRERLDGEVRRAVSQMVFAYYRWFGWVRELPEMRDRLERARDMDEQFAAAPASISDSEIAARAVPPWVRDFASLPLAALRAWQSPPPLWLRARRGARDEVAAALGDCLPHPALPDALEYRGENDLFATPEFKRGLFEIQDLSSQLVGHLCAAQPGETWWDACAGEGGKTLHLSSLMDNQGLIWATDRAEWRLKHLKTRAARAQVFNCRIKPWPRIEHLPTRTKFDGILLDAPCSGLGTWGRNPHARWTVSPKDIEELAVLQGRLLAGVAEALKPGGRLVYSVCTLSPLETTGVAEAFTAAHPEFVPAVPEKPPLGQIENNLLWLWPHDVRANGMFVAAWRRSG